MAKEQKFYRCNHCGNLVGLIDNAGVPMVCCGEKMHELKPNTVDASQEKHLPIVKAAQNIGDCLLLTIGVGSVMHHQTAEHHIEFIYLQTENGGQRLSPAAEPTATFALYEDKALAAYAYCNLHGLWKSDLSL